MNDLKIWQLENLVMTEMIEPTEINTIHLVYVLVLVSQDDEDEDEPTSVVME